MTDDRKQVGKNLLKRWVPPALLHFLRKKPGITWSGNYGSWEEARKESEGYDSDLIVNQVKNSLLKVKSGKAQYERDSVLFDEIQYSWPLLGGLMWVAALGKGELNVLDFGGSLGTTYYQNRKFLAHLPHVRWNIVEQKKVVEAGKEHFEDDRLRFYYDIESCMEDCSPNTILLSSVLQYLEKPHDLLGKIMGLGFEYIILDRTAIAARGDSQLKIQTVPKEIYPASYPCWFFNRSSLLKGFESEYDIIESFDSFEETDQGAVFEGHLLRRKEKLQSVQE